MREIGKLTFTGLGGLSAAYRRIPTCACQVASEGMLPTTHMPEMGPDQILVRIIFGYTPRDNVFVIESTEDIATANAQYHALSDGSQHWYIVDRATAEGDFRVAA